MDNPIWGILTILFSSGAYFLSVYYQRKDSYIPAISLLMLGGLILRFFTACDFFLHPWDEVYHAVVAKHMIQHPFVPTLYENPVLPYDYRNWAGNHIWLHKQPLPLWSMALSMSIFGVNEIALRLPSIFLTTIGIALTYYIGAYFFDRRTGYLAAFFYSVNGLIIEMTAGRVATDHIDVFFLFFIELAIFFSIVFARKQKTIYNIGAALCIGVAILCKWLPALIVLPIWLLIVIDSKKITPKKIILQSCILIIITLIVVLPWQLYIYHSFPMEASSEASHNMRHITETLDNQGGPIYYYLDKIRINYGELVYLPLVWFLGILLRGQSHSKLTGLLVWLLIPILFFSLLKTKMQGYILFCSPAIFMVTAAYFFYLKDYTWNKAMAPIYKYALALILLAMVILPVRYSIERVKPFQKDRSPAWALTLKNMKIKQDGNVVLFNYPHEIAAMFYTDWTVYAGIPPLVTINGLISKGHTVIINDAGSIPKEIKSKRNIVFLHLCDATN